MEDNSLIKIATNTIFVIILMALIVGGFFTHKRMTLHIYVNDFPYVYDIKQGDRIDVYYIHSVHLTPVHEVFVVNDDQSFQFISTEYDDIGWGTPYRFQKYVNAKHFLFKKDNFNKLTLYNLDYGFISLNEPRFFINNQLLKIIFNENIIKIKSFITK